MPIGDWVDTTPAPSPAPKKELRFPDSNGTGMIPWPANIPLAAALTAAIGSVVSQRNTFNATVFLQMTVKED